MAKKSSKGALLKLAGVAVAYLKSINGPNPENNFFDATDLTSDIIEDGEPTGQPSPGSISGEAFCDHGQATHAAILAQIQDPISNGKASWTVEYPDGTTRSFTGTAKTWTPKAAVGEGFMVDYEIKLATFPASS